MKKKPTGKIESLSKSHKKNDFDCGAESLNVYLKQQASQEQKKRISSCYVYTENSTEVLGYYTLSASAMSLQDLEESSRKKLPYYPRVPVTLLGRLAADLKTRGQGLGGWLLMDAMHRSLEVSGEIGSYAVVVDVLDVSPDPLEFYRNYGFVATSTEPRTLYLPMDTIRRLRT